MKHSPYAGSGSDFAGLEFVHITPNPRLARFNRTHERMLRVVEMFGGVFVLGRITTGRMSADQAHAQMDPGVANLHAVFTHMLVRFRDFDLVEMSAFYGH
jgi:hypothetical protein